MAITEQPTIHRPGFRAGREAGESILWLTGDHDVTTVRALRLVLVDLIALDDSDIVVDLGEATFVGSVLVGELLCARRHVAAGGRSLHIRAASPFVRRMFTICDARRLFEQRRPPIDP